MNKVKIKYIVDFLTLISFIITAISGIAIKFFMPRGVRQGRFQEFLGISKSVWSEVHDICGIIMIVFALLHVVSYWKMFVCMTKNFFQSGKCEVNNLEVK